MSVPPPLPAAAERLLTAEDLWRMGDRGRWVELDRGRLVSVNPPGGRHGDVVAELIIFLRVHVRRHDLGWVTTETGFIIGRDPETVRGPDVAFVAKARVPVPIPEGYVPLAPDLVVEVVSPGDTYTEVLTKVDQYLAAGVREVWLIDPPRGRAEVRARGEQPRVLSPTDSLASPLLPGLSIRLADVLGG